MRPILRSYLAEINLGSTLPGANSNIEFPDFPQLRNVVIYGIEVIKSNVLSTSPTQKTIVTTLAGITMTVADKDQKNIIESYPCTDLDPTTTGGLIREFKPFSLNLVKSYITIVNSTGLNANESVCFNVFYATEKEVAEQLARAGKAGIVTRKKM